MKIFDIYKIQGVYKVKRKVIQIANSTQLISLPRKWSIKYGVKKGDEIEVEEQGNSIVLMTENSNKSEYKEIDSEKFGLMLPRTIFALYKQGVDELKINFNDRAMLKIIQDSLGKEMVGYEIIDQGQNYCSIKNVSGNLEDFGVVLRRTFLLLINMANESFQNIKKQDFDHLKSVAFLEESNNRFTTSCRRLLNKKGTKDYKYLGPLYYIIEEMENIADQYKYLCNALHKFKGKKVKINEEVLNIYERTNRMLNTFYELFYKFDEKKVAEIGNERKFIVEKGLELFEKKLSNIDYLMLHYQLTIMQKIFCLIGPYLVLTL